MLTVDKVSIPKRWKSETDQIWYRISTSRPTHINAGEPPTDEKDFQSVPRLASTSIWIQDSPRIKAMTKAAQTTMPKMCHDRFAPSAKMDNTGRAKKRRHDSRD